MLTIADKGGWGSEKIFNKGFLWVQKMWIERTIGYNLTIQEPLILADVICEQPLIAFVVELGANTTSEVV